MTNEQLFNEYTANTASILKDVSNVQIIKYLLEDYRKFVLQYDRDIIIADMLGMSIEEYREYSDRELERSL